MANAGPDTNKAQVSSRSPLLVIKAEKPVLHYICKTDESRWEIFDFWKVS
jgi:hypothetical protein